MYIYIYLYIYIYIYNINMHKTCIHIYTSHSIEFYSSGKFQIF